MAAIVPGYNYINNMCLEDYFIVSPVKVSSFSQSVTFLDDEDRSGLIPRLANVKLQPPTIQFAVTTKAPTLEERNYAMALLQRELFRGFERANSLTSATSNQLYLTELRCEAGASNYLIEGAYFEGDFVVERGVDYARAELLFVVPSYTVGKGRGIPVTATVKAGSNSWSYFDIDNQGTAPCPLVFDANFSSNFSFANPGSVILAVANTEVTAPPANGARLTARFRDVGTATSMRINTAEAVIVFNPLGTKTQPYSISGIYSWLNPGFNRVFIGGDITTNNIASISCSLQERNF